MNNLSVGVRSVFSDVNWRSKFDTSLRCFCGIKDKELRYSFKRIKLKKAHNLWFEWRLHFAILDFLPIDSSEEAVISYIIFADRSAAQTLLRIFGQKLKR
jgi:hypothetical protein